MIVAIASGKGGTGKTSLAVNLARTLERTLSLPVQLLDCDVEEPNAHLFLAGTPLGEETINIAVPDFDPDKCDACDKCVDFCQFNALASVGKTPLLFPELCHGCGGCMLVCPQDAIREKDYVNSQPTSESTIESLKQTFGDGEFRKFVCSDVVYWVAITTFQTGLPFFVTSLLKLPETTTTIYFVLMTGVSVLFYLPVNILANKVGKKRLLLVAFVIFTCAFAFAGALGSAVLGFIPAMAQGLVLSVVGAIPMAAFGILPQAIVANIADASSKTTGQDRQGMFYAARTFAMKMGQSVAMLLFTGVSTIGMASGAGYRIAAVCAAVLCGLGGIVFAFYNEKKVLGVLET